MTTDDIIKAINTVFATPEEFEATLGLLAKQSQLRQIEIQIDQLDAKRREVLTPIENERIDLNNQRLAVLDSLKPQP